jgi:hypothetical protein
LINQGSLNAAAPERMMTIQDVVLKAMAKKISWLDAAGIVGVCDRTMRRMREGYQQFGGHRVPLATAEEVLRLYREVYFDLNIRRFHEKLRDEHKIELSDRWVQLALQGEAAQAGSAPAEASAAGVARDAAAPGLSLPNRPR